MVAQQLTMCRIARWLPPASCSFWRLKNVGCLEAIIFRQERSAVGYAMVPSSEREKVVARMEH